MAMGRVVHDSDLYGTIIRPMIGVPRGTNRVTLCRRCKSVRMSLVLYQIIGICWGCLVRQYPTWYREYEPNLKGRTYDVS